MASGMTNCITILGLLLSLFSGGLYSIDECIYNENEPKHIELCHIQPPQNRIRNITCDSPSKGFTVRNLRLAPRSDFEDCDRFSLLHLLNASCLREKVSSKEQLESAVFDVLDKVSGRREISTSTIVKRFNVALKDQEEKIDSAFVSFGAYCEPARKQDSEDNKVINMCSEDKVNKPYVYLTLPDMASKPAVPSRCRCSLRTSQTQTSVVPLDIRLQHIRDHRCNSSVMLKISTADESNSLECEGKRAWYGGSPVLMNSAQDITVELSSVSQNNWPTSVWMFISVNDKHSIMVTCEGMKPMSEGEGEEEEEKEETSAEKGDEQEDQEDNKLTVYLAVGIGAAGVMVIAVIVWFKTKRCRQNKEKTVDDEKPESSEYAVPENPGSSTNRRPPTPPPLPTTPPPSSPPPELFPQNAGPDPPTQPPLPTTPAPSSPPSAFFSPNAGPDPPTQPPLPTTPTSSSPSSAFFHQNAGPDPPTQPPHPSSRPTSSPAQILPNNAAQRVNPLPKPKRTYSVTQDRVNNDGEDADEYDRLLLGDEGKRNGKLKKSESQKKDNYDHVEPENYYQEIR